MARLGHRAVIQRLGQRRAHRFDIPGVRQHHVFFRAPELDRHRNAELLALLAELRERHAGDIRAEELALAQPLSWEQVRAMAASGVQFGSHTVSHAILSRLGADELRDELMVSKARLEAELQTPCDSIAYPVGRSFAYTPKNLAEVGLAGYRLGLAYNAGINWSHALDLFALQRQSVELHMSREYFRAMLNLPSWFQ